MLIISEGDSGAGSLCLGRDVDTCGVFPIRGKLISCLKNSMEDYLENEEIKQIAQILGCGIFKDYDSKKLRYGRVGICVDADQDALNIACLITTFFYVCLPKFLQEGRLYWIHAPLYAKGSEYIFTEDDWIKVKSKKGFKRMKGIGEMTAREVEESLFGKFKQWEQLTPKDWNKFSELIEELMGTKVTKRRERLFKQIDFDTIKYL